MKHAISRAEIWVMFAAAMAARTTPGTTEGAAEHIAVRADRMMDSFDKRFEHKPGTDLWQAKATP